MVLQAIDFSNTEYRFYSENSDKDVQKPLSQMFYNNKLIFSAFKHILKYGCLFRKILYKENSFVAQRMCFVENTENSCLYFHQKDSILKVKQLYRMNLFHKCTIKDNDRVSVAVVNNQSSIYCIFTYKMCIQFYALLASNT